MGRLAAPTPAVKPPRDTARHAFSAFRAKAYVPSGRRAGQHIRMVQPPALAQCSDTGAPACLRNFLRRARLLYQLSLEPCAACACFPSGRVLAAALTFGQPCARPAAREHSVAASSLEVVELRRSSRGSTTWS